jgi:hypothetical protein
MYIMVEHPGDPMSSFLAIQNFLRREWLTRRAWLVALVALLGLPFFYESEVRAAYAGFGFFCILPLLALGLAVTPDTEADRYWASLGGRPLHRAFVRVFGHLGLLVVVGLLLLPHLRWSAWKPAEAPLFLPLALALLGLAVGTVYVSAALARRSMSAAAALAGPLLVGGLLALGVGIDERLGNWSVVEGVGVRLAVLVAAGLVVLVRKEGRLAGGTEARRLLLGATGLAALVTLLHAGWSGRPLLITPTLAGTAADGTAAVYLPQQAAGPVASRRAVLWRQGVGFRQVGPAGVTWGTMLPDARLLLFAPGDGGGVWVGDEHNLTHCPLPAASSRVIQQTSADGAVLLLLSEPTAAIVVHPDGRCESAVGESGSLGALTWRRTPEGFAFVTPTPPMTTERTGLVTSGLLYDMDSGDVWPVAADFEGQGGALFRVGDGVRVFFHEGSVLEVGPEGGRSRTALTLLGAVAP